MLLAVTSSVCAGAIRRLDHSLHRYCKLTRHPLFGSLDFALYGDARFAQHVRYFSFR